ncbi:MAG: C25 family cysteine peptidase [Flavobacteriales bacterium]
MRRLLLLFSILVLGYSALSQPYGNEWIDYDQTYFEFKIVEKGLYRIDSTALANAGFPVSSIDPRNIQVFNREKEIFIYIDGGSDGVFNSTDYIEFFGYGNDGWLDSTVYEQPSYQPDKYYSLYNDTISYYITWNNSTNNKRIILETNLNFSGHTPLDWCWHSRYLDYRTVYLEGPKLLGASSPYFKYGEGWFGSSFTTINVDVPSPFPYTGAGAPDARCYSVTASSNNPTITGLAPNHHIEIAYGTSNIVAVDTLFHGYQQIKASFEFPASSLGTSTTRFRHRNIPISGLSASLTHISSVTLDYPRTFNFGGANYLEFRLPFNSTNPSSYIEISNFNTTGVIYWMENNQHKYLIGSPSASGFNALVPNFSSGEAKCIALNRNVYTNITTIIPINNTGQFINYLSQTTDEAYIIISHKTLWTGAQAYANYRSSALGGNHNIVLADIDDLYHQFGGGIVKNSAALRRFSKFAFDNFSSRPEFLFIIGKSVREATETFLGTNPGTRKNATAYNACLVPSLGFPASDNLITSGFTGDKMHIDIPVGRISTNDNAQVFAYLQKIQLYEAQQDPNSFYSIATKEWQKNVIHFGGGSSASEQQLFAQYLNNFGNIIEDTLFGGNVNTFLKTSSDPISVVDFQKVGQLLQEGVSLITFFGHATQAGFDQSIDEPANWNNTGKYPFVVGNGCYTGDVHQPQNYSVSESFVLTPNVGSIGFLSTVKLGFSPSLYSYTLNFYDKVGRANYGDAVGKNMKRVSQMYISQSQIPIDANEVTISGMSLQGDPALKINYHEAPEIEIIPQRVFFTPDIINLSVDSFNINIVVTNIGRAFHDTVVVDLTRNFPNGTSVSYSKNMGGLYYRDTVVFRLPTQHNIGVGLNSFEISVDIPSVVTEHQEEITNNQLIINKIINSNAILPIYPYEFAIVPNNQVTLKGSTSDPLADLRVYRFEIDTTDEFNSPFKKYQLITAPGGVVNALPSNWLNANTNSPDPLLCGDSTVYFWRTSPDSSVYNWYESSFQYINGRRGWGQAHFFQYKKNSYNGLEYNRPNRSFDFGVTSAQLKCNVFTNPSIAAEYGGTNWQLNNSVEETNGCSVTPSIHVAVIDPVTLESWGSYCNGQNANKQFGNSNNNCGCRPRVEKHFVFRQNTSDQLDSLMSMVNNHIPNGHYVLIHTWIRADYSMWDTHNPALYGFFQSLGSTNITQGTPNNGFILFFKKGDPASFQEVYDIPAVPGQSSFISFQTNIFGTDNFGSLKTPLAGPAFEWNALHFKQIALEPNSADTTRLRLYGINYQGTETLLMDSLYTHQDSILPLSTIIDATTHPFARLEATTKDTATFTPAQFKRWQLVYSPVPELAVNPAKGYYNSLTNSSINQGDQFKIGVAIENVSEYDMDSLLVKYWIQDAANQKHYITYPRQDSLRSEELIFDTLTINTTLYPGLNSFWVEANPYTNPPQQDQLEQYYFNNLLQIPFETIQDKINPILDVTFDGTHILNGDIVSPKPFISIKLDDENPFMLLNEQTDTSNFQVFVRYPGNFFYTPIRFRDGVGNEIMRFYPATGSDNVARIEFEPEFNQDGVYRLRVQGADKSGNLSGDLNYEVDFEVINRSTITNVLNYPNPFSTSTRFVFTLTGEQVPNQFRIQIMTISGRVVREIDLAELGPIRVGRNITEYAWDGRDQFGDRLANGIYLYRVIAKINGQNIEHRSSGADGGFHKGFGKMCIIK